MKQTLTLEQLDAQTALELPNRDMFLITIVLTNVLNNLTVDVDVRNINIAVQVCAVVELIDTDLLGGNVLTCDIEQR
ncbi:MAG: hypothetical protein LC804_11260 [Acidobacteria bacterium]|nr:hypothetical protein [Acidobacteriota bacterium]